MKARQESMPREWLITDERIGDRLWAAVRRLPRGSGVILRHHSLSPGERERLKRRLRRLAAVRGLMIVDEAHGRVARVHDAREIALARLRGAPVLLLSPMFATRSHPDWLPLPSVRAAALRRLAGERVLALGGMDRERFRRVERLGFAGWAGIDAWLGQAKGCSRE